MADEITGWLLDVYAGGSGVVVWLLGDDGQRHQFQQPFTTTCYASGKFPQLRSCWQYMRGQRMPVQLSRTQRDDLFDGRIDVLAIEADTAVFPRLFRRIKRQFPDLEFYDADIPVSVQYAARFDAYPTMRCQVIADDGTITQTIPLESRWQVDAPPIPLRVMTIAPNSDPAHRPPTTVRVSCNGKAVTYPLSNGRLFLVGLMANIKRNDPDLILTQYGDTWLFPHLRMITQKTDLTFNPSRDAQRPYLTKRANSYATYGMMLYRGAQTHLYGRYHIDIKNALMFNEYDISGVLEQARITGMPVQEMARRSPGAGITAMQMIAAIQRGVMIPHTKQQPTRERTLRELMRADRGGMVYQPQIGLHHNVIEIDFVSMYPSIISLFNISPETVNIDRGETAVVPELNTRIDQTRRGLLPETVQPIIEKRTAIKAQLATMTRQDCRYRALKSRATALKWLLVVSFGYAGYRRAKFGNVEAYEAITAYSREMMLRAKEVAESLGYELIHMYIDGLWLKREGVKTVTAVQPLLDEIEQATGLPIALEGFYKWVAFLPSKMEQRVAVPNRYFGVFEDGEIKVRGIELRRHDTPPFVANIQRTALELLSKVDGIDDCLPAIIYYTREQFTRLRQRQIDPAQLLVSKRITRMWYAYKMLPPAGQAARQLATVGKDRYPGQRVQFIFTTAGVHAWDYPEPVNRTQVDCDEYIKLAIRALDAVLRPFGIQPQWLREWLLQDWYQGHFYLGRVGRCVV